MNIESLISDDTMKYDLLKDKNENDIYNITKNYIDYITLINLSDKNKISYS